MINIEQQNGISVVQMGHGPANAMDTDFCQALAETFKELGSSDTRAIVLTGQGRIFSAGVDLPQLLDGGVAYVRQFLPALSDMLESAFFCNKPVISAVNGHAIAGGCLLACTADRSLMARGKGQVGVPELRVGVPFPIAALESMRAKISPVFFEEITLGGATYGPEQALERGLVDELVEAEELMERALAAAESLASIGSDVFAISKQQARHPARMAMDVAHHQFGAKINDLWESEKTHEAIRNFVAKTLKK